MTEPHPEAPPVWKTRRFRVGLLFVIVAALILTLVLQNFDTTEVQFFFWRAEAPLAGVIVSAMLLGAAGEILLRALLRRRKARKLEAARVPPPAGDQPPA